MSPFFDNFLGCILCSVRAWHNNQMKCDAVVWVHNLKRKWFLCGYEHVDHSVCVSTPSSKRKDWIEAHNLKYPVQRSYSQSYSAYESISRESIQSCSLLHFESDLDLNLFLNDVVLHGNSLYLYSYVNVFISPGLCWSSTTPSPGWPVLLQHRTASPVCPCTWPCSLRCITPF